jgi:hypothetical protein
MEKETKKEEEKNRVNKEKRHEGEEENMTQFLHQFLFDTGF